MDQRKLSMMLLAVGGFCVVVGTVWLIAGGGDDAPNAETASVEDESAATAESAPSSSTSSTSTSTTTATSTSTTTTTTTIPSPDETPQEFLAAFNEAFANGDVTFLRSRLNEATVSIYGSDQCDAYVAGIVTTEAPDLIMREVGTVGPWIYVIDDISTPIQSATPVEVSRLVTGETVIQELHWKLVDGRFTWFTDCGDPL